MWSWTEDIWFAEHHAHNLTEEFKIFWLRLYDTPDKYTDDGREEYWIRCAFCLIGWKAAMQYKETLTPTPKPKEINMSFKVTIQEIKDVTKFATKGYELLKRLHINNEEEYNAIPREDRSEYKRNEDGSYTRDVYGYPEKQEVTETKSITVYEQVVEQLDISGVIAKINLASDPRVPVLAKRADRD